MLDGTTNITDFDKTEANRNLVRQYSERVLVEQQLDQTDTYLDDRIMQHNPEIADGIAALCTALGTTVNGKLRYEYDKIHRVLAEGNFVLCMSEGRKEGEHSSFYDLYRVAEGKIVEHWNTIETIAPRSEWKNRNGKF